MTANSYTLNQCTVSTAKRLASLFWYLIASTIDALHNTINGYEIACKWNSKYNVHYVWSELMLILYFKNCLFSFLVDFKLRKSSSTITAALQCSRIDICTSCFVYDLSNTKFCPIGSVLTKHPVASQIFFLKSSQICSFRLQPMIISEISF